MEKIEQAKKIICEMYGVSDIRGLLPRLVTDESYTEIECEVVETLANEGFTYAEANKIWSKLF